MFFRFFDVLMIISIDLDAKPYLRYWNFALTSTLFSTGSQASFLDFARHCSKTALDKKKCSFAAVALKFLNIRFEPVEILA